MRTEAEDQARLCTWMTRQGIRFYSVPNGGTRNYREAIRLKQTGVSPGVPDICIPVPRREYHGLYLELKREKGGRLSDAQIDWLSFLRKMGYHADVANGFNEAVSIISAYMALP